ncbi:glycosyl transferase family 2 [Methanococcus vannielii SB]|uniref:Glycosyl transferase family 2 n=1 Tax=Methanococcus vannielii (strain ATCC 35089 / DSM 1224 / JCM 13029 / OCM 148 / SB) TaxID=406327 RepID=A6US83_METVS|nr:glycosyltransferase family 2 protein [Methanococcus vannielii]ABR55355.1 glycosyl transferase family 2 [Methanococcus vannielii SB]
MIAVIPAYNEEKNIISVLKELSNLDIDTVVVDDGSLDKTRKIIEEFLEKNEFKNKIFPIYKRKNEGKSKALEEGTNYAIRLGYDTIIYMDGDYQHKPKDIPLLIKKMETENADAVFGVRKYKNIPLHRQFSNFLASFIMSLTVSAFSRRAHIFKDIQCGFRVIKSSFLHGIYFGEGYSVEHLVALQLAQKNAKIAEEYVSIDYHQNAISYITTKKIIDVMKEVVKYIFNKKNK